MKATPCREEADVEESATLDDPVADILGLQA